MTHEFYYTSAPHGLVKGSKGFCPVAMTKGIPSFLSERLEDLSGYKPLFTALDARNPVNWAHFRLDLGGHTYHVVSRICSAGLDYSERTNKFAHHIVLTPDDLPAAGPAWLLQQKGFLETAWDQGEPRWLSAGRKVPQGNAYTKVCKTWEKLTGDAGWAGVLAETAVSAPARPAIVLYEPGTDVLALFAEALLLLPEKYRWRVTFSTYASSVPPGETCLWRGLTKAEAEHDKRSLLHGALVISLGSTLGRARGGALVESARTGKAADIAAITPSSSTSPLTTPTRSRQSSAREENEPEPSLSQVSLASLGPSRNDPIQEVGEDAPAESSTRRYLEIGLSSFLGLGVGFFLLFVGAVTGLIDLPNREQSRTNSELQTRVADLEVEKERIPALNARIAQLNGQVGSQKKETKEVGLSLEELGKKTKKQIGELNEKISKLDKELEEKEKLWKTAESARKKLNADHVKLQTEHDALEKKYALAKPKPDPPKTEGGDRTLPKGIFDKQGKLDSIVLDKIPEKSVPKLRVKLEPKNYFQLDEKADKWLILIKNPNKPNKPDSFLNVKLSTTDGVMHLVLTYDAKAAPKDLEKAIRHLEEDLDFIVTIDGKDRHYKLKETKQQKDSK